MDKDGVSIGDYMSKSAESLHGKRRLEENIGTAFLFSYTTEAQTVYLKNTLRQVLSNLEWPSKKE